MILVPDTRGSRGGTAHSGLHRLAETVHCVAHAKLRPKILRVAVVGGDATGAALFVANDHPVRQRVKVELPAEHGEQLHRHLIGALCHGLSGGLVETSERSPTRVLDAGGFAVE